MMDEANLLTLRANKTNVNNSFQINNTSLLKANVDDSLPPYIIISIVLSIASLLLNFLSVSAILNAPGRLSTQLRLAVSLTMADVAVALSVLLHTSIRTFTGPSRVASSHPDDRLVSSCSLVFIFALNVSGHLMCLFTLDAMGLDHYIAIFKPLRYASIVTKRRTAYLIGFIWITSLIGGYSMFLSAIENYEKVRNFLNYCDAVMYNDYHSEYLVFAVAILSIFLLLFLYISVFCEVQRIKGRGRSNDPEKNNRKTLWTTLLILGTFIILWTPSCLFQVILVIQVIRDPESVRQSFPSLIRTGQYLYCLMLCNGLADPVIYAIRVRDVKLGYRLMYWKLSLALRKRCLPRNYREELSLSGSYAMRSRCSQSYLFPPLLRSTSRNGAPPTGPPEEESATF